MSDDAPDIYELLEEAVTDGPLLDLNDPEDTHKWMGLLDALAEHDRTVAEKAWDEAAEHVDENWFWHDNGRDSNPYRPLSVSNQTGVFGA